MSRKSRRDIILEQEKDDSPIDWESIARECIRVYFSNKQWFCGGPIPSSELYTEDSIKTVLRTQFDSRWEDIVHNDCLPVIKNKQKKDCGNLGWQVHCLIKILNEMGQMWIPKEFRPGLVLLYFKFCKAVSIPGPPLL